MAGSLALSGLRRVQKSPLEAGFWSTVKDQVAHLILPTLSIALGLTAVFPDISAPRCSASGGPRCATPTDLMELISTQVTSGV
jgi:hypothetical protein